MSKRGTAVPDCLLNGELYLNRSYLGSSICGEVSFMPKDFCSPDDVRSLFACDNDMTVSDLLCRISNYSQGAQFHNMDPVTDSSQWKLYDVRKEKGSRDVLKMFSNNFRVLDIPTFILEQHNCLMMSMRPEHTRKCAIIHPGDVTRKYLAQSVLKTSAEQTRAVYDEMQEEIARQHMCKTDIRDNGKEQLSTEQLARDKYMLEHLKRKYENSLSDQHRYMQQER